MCFSGCHVTFRMGVNKPSSCEREEIIRRGERPPLHSQKAASWLCGCVLQGRCRLRWCFCTGVREQLVVLVLSLLNTWAVVQLFLLLSLNAMEKSRSLYMKARMECWGVGMFLFFEGFLFLLWLCSFRGLFWAWPIPGLQDQPVSRPSREEDPTEEKIVAMGYFLSHQKWQQFTRIT